MSLPLATVPTLPAIGTGTLALFLNASGKIHILANSGAGRFHVGQLVLLFYKSQDHSPLFTRTRWSTAFRGTR